MPPERFAPQRGQLHHVELWVPDLGRATASIGWLLEQLGYVPFRTWEVGRSWRLDPTYIVVEQSPAMDAAEHQRTHPGLNHLAFHAGSRDVLERLVTESGDHGWQLMFPDRHPFAGGPYHCAAYLENADGFEVELVAQIPPE